MDKQKLQKSRKVEKPKGRTWFELINDESDKLVIPLGPPFQADIPEWIIPRSTNESSDAKWLGTQVWSNRRKSQDSKNLGKGRPDSCDCTSPGSVECVKRHVADRKVRMQRHLGPAFHKWKFDDMGEDVSRTWNVEQQRRFDSVVRRSSDKNSFVQLALESFPSKSRRDIVSYYLNVYVPRRISARTRAGYEIVDSSDDDVSVEVLSRLKTPQKRSKPDDSSDASSNSECVQMKYLKGPR